MKGAHAAFLRRSGGGYEAVALFRSLRFRNARRSGRARSWHRTRADALVSLRVMCK
jgi:hypothetical protein